MEPALRATGIIPAESSLALAVNGDANEPSVKAIAGRPHDGLLRGRRGYKLIRTRSASERACIFSITRAR